MEVILPGATIGIIGGGQLAKMLAMAAKTMGYRVAVYDQDAEAPAFCLADSYMVGSFSDRHLLAQFAAGSAVLVYEFENIDVKTLDYLVAEGCLVPQGTKVLQYTQNRLQEKRFVEQHSEAIVAPYRAVNDIEQLRVAINEIGFPAVLKTCHGGYDGRGQLIIKHESDMVMAENLLKHPCVLEQFVPFNDEYSIIAVRDRNADIAFFPPARNVHAHNILEQSWVGDKPLAATLAAKMERIAGQLAAAFETVGPLAVEFFVCGEQLYVNELAPRPHNSGHYTIEGCKTSQFEQHIRAATGLPLGATSVVAPTVMVNLLGQHIPAFNEYLPKLSEHAHIHLYGKKAVRTNRKMGHVTFTGFDLNEVELFLQTVININ